MSTSSKKGLGKGLDTLFGNDYETAEQPTLIKLSRIEPREDQPRKIFNEEALQALADSISQYGIIQPITVRKLENDQYQIIAGERRWRAAKLAGLSEVPVNIIEADDKKASEIALVENLQREDLNPIEEAKGYRTLMNEYNLTQDEVSRSVGKSRPAIANSLRLLMLSQDVLDYVEKGELSAGHARTLVVLTDAQLQLSCAKEIIEKGYSVRKAEQLVSKILKDQKNQKTDDSNPMEIDYSKEVSESLTKTLGRKVSLNDGKKIGRIVIEYYGPDDREKLINMLKQMR